VTDATLATISVPFYRMADSTLMEHFQMMTRRQALQLLGSAAGTALVLSAFPALAQNVPVTDLAVPGPLGDVALGPANAKVTIVEYASLTCSHCAHFHKEIYPELKKRYIDTGKVRFLLREFPLDPLATAGFMLARCDGESKYYPITDMLFDQQQNWAFTDKPLDALRQLMKQAGFSQEKFDACLRDQKLYDAVNAVKNKGADQFKVDATPTFFINGQRHSGSMSIDELEKIIKPLLDA
jgi:protein-disulfide isomerase